MKKLSRVLSFSAPLVAILVAGALGACRGKSGATATESMSGSAMSGSAMSGDHAMSGDKMSGDHAMSGDKMSGDSHQRGSASGDHSMGSGHAM